MAAEQEEYATLKFDDRDGVAHITLNRPEANNALNLGVAQELLDAVLRCDEDPSVRAVVIAGEGRTFCVGGDLKAFVEQGEQLPHHLKEVTTYLHAAVSRMEHSSQVIVRGVGLVMRAWCRTGVTGTRGYRRWMLDRG